MKPTILFPVFEKEKYVGRAIKSCLEQTDFCTVLIFGPKPSDKTWDEIEKAVGVSFRPDSPGDPRYAHVGKVKFKWVWTPPNGFGGMNHGMNLDFNFIQDFITGDFCLFTGADDVMAPNRVERVRAVFEEHNPSWVVNAQTMMHEDGTVDGVAPGIQGSQWIDPAGGIKWQVGSSGGFAWATDLYRKYAPINHIESNDVILPSLALLERGMYYIDEPLQTMYLHDDLNNLGLEGQVRGARDETHTLQLRETMAFQGLSNWTSVLNRMNQHHPGRTYDPAFINEIYSKIFSYSSWWVDQRAQLTMQKVKPLAFGAKALGME